MRLRTLRLHGFKSFADRTQLEFRDGITAIVGSNGCGKSNIADAIRWVLGEQRASAIRGAKMDEVIFQGTTKRRPLNFGEVALLFSNEEGRVEIPQTEIEIARKTFREGGSEYSLNRTACRLRDIHTLLRDTGLGSNAYSIIEAGMIETLLSDRAEERRSLFEEAAGIGRYKDSRQATTRRLDATETDLERLGDLVAEVESKVRSLARQRRRAQRLQELQARRLNLEIAIGRRELARLEGVIEAGSVRAAELQREEEESASARVEAEAAAERQRGELAELSRRRAEVAGRLEEVRSRLHAREREALLADERRGNAELRIGQLVRERAEQEARRTGSEADAERLAALLTTQGEALADARGRLEQRAEESGELRGLFTAERQRSDAATHRVRELARQLAVAEGERDTLQARARDAAEAAGRQRQRQQELAATIAGLQAQTELWATRGDDLRLRADAAADAAEGAREEIAVLRRRESAARDALRAADDRLSRLAAQVGAREAVERSYEGFAPAVAALMAARGRFPGIRGPLADFVGRPPAPASAAAAEVFLGPLLHALVVDDLATVREIRAWFRGEWKGGGSLLLLPLDAPALALAEPAGAGWGTGEGSGWVEALLGELGAGDEDPLSGHAAGRARASAAGDVMDGRGLVRLVQRLEGEGILGRREQLAALRAERAEAEVRRDAARHERDGLLEALAEAEERAREAEEMRRAAAAELQRVQAEEAAHSHRVDRLARERDEVARVAEQQGAAARDAEERRAAVEARLATTREELVAAEAAAALASARSGELESRWESLRDEESEFRVAVARAEGELRETERRLGGARHAADAARARVAAIDREAAELRTTLEALSGVRERAGEEMATLFAARDADAATLRNVETRAAEVEAEAASSSALARRARTREAECAEERHALALRLAEARSQRERVRERLEAEWGRPWEALVEAAEPVEEAELEAGSVEVREIAAQIETLGPVNMLAVEEHEEESRRLDFLVEQQKDLVAARDDLAAAIRQINRTAREVFVGTFDAIRENFQRTFHSLFQGGECDVWLADPSDPLESPIEIQASPKGKKTQRIHLLSGGERTLTALALLFAIYLVKPSPFCLLDEVDAPLDESNVGRFIQLLQDFKAGTQFVVITHNTRTMEAADWVYGVTMQEPGVSSIVGVELEGAWSREGRVA